MNALQNNGKSQNNMKIFYFILFSIFLTFSVVQAQEIKPLTIQNPKIDTTLTISELASPVYILNDDYAVFQDENNQRIIINPDIQTFKVEDNGLGLFATDKNGIYYKGVFIKTSPDGFTRLNDCRDNDCIWKTNDKVFKDTTNITDSIDVPSYQHLAYNYFIDKNFIYFKGKKIEKSDGNSANTTLIYGGVYDKNYFYSNGNIATYKGDTIYSINAVLGKTTKYVFKYPSIIDIQTEMDVETIKPLSRQYAIDKNGVYFWNEKLPILPKNFSKIKVWEQNQRVAISDGKNVYNGSHLMTVNIDAKTFGIIPSTHYFFDKKHIYNIEWNEEKQKSEIVPFPFDYTKKVTLKNTFVGNHYRYLIYENQVYDFSRKIVFKNLSKNDISLVRNTYKTINQVNGKIIKVPTLVDSLEVMNTAIRKNSIYKGKEKLYKLNGNKLIPIVGIDFQTITVNKQNFLADKDYIYANGYRIIKNDGLELIAIFKKPIIPNPSTDMNNEKRAILFIDQYFFRNNEGYWLVVANNRILTDNDEVRIRSLGKELDENFKKILLIK